MVARTGLAICQHRYHVRSQPALSILKPHYNAPTCWQFLARSCTHLGLTLAFLSFCSLSSDLKLGLPLCSLHSFLPTLACSEDTFMCHPQGKRCHLRLIGEVDPMASCH